MAGEGAGRRRMGMGGLGGVGGLEEGVEEGGVFAAGGGFDAAGDVDGVGLGLADGELDVIGVEASGEDDRAAEGFGLAGEVPIEGATGSAALAGDVGIEEPGIDLVGGEEVEGGGILDAESFDHLKVEPAAEGRGFVAVELDGIEGAGLQNVEQRGGSRVDEDADPGEERGQGAADGGGGVGGDGPWALGVEHESDGVGAGVGGGEGVIGAGDTADFHADDGHEAGGGFRGPGGGH